MNEIPPTMMLPPELFTRLQEAEIGQFGTSANAQETDALSQEVNKFFKETKEKLVPKETKKTIEAKDLKKETLEVDHEIETLLKELDTRKEVIKPKEQQIAKEAPKAPLEAKKQPIDPSPRPADAIKKEHERAEVAQKREEIKKEEKRTEEKSSETKQEKLKEREVENGFFHQPEKQFQEQREKEKKQAIDAIEESALEKHVAETFFNYMHQESKISQLTGRPLSHLDVMLLFIEVLKLDVQSRDNEKIARRLERNQQIIHMKNVADSFQSQGKWQLFTAIGSGMLGVIAGAAPIVGYSPAGDYLKDTLAKWMNGIADMEKTKFYKSASKMAESFSKIYENTGAIHRTFAEGDRSWDQHISEMAKTDAEECTRTLDELLRDWNNVEDWLFQVLRMEHNNATHLYGGN